MNFIGNSAAKNLIERLAASELPHVLLVGPTGHGKTSLVSYTKRRVVTVNGTAIEDRNDLYACLKSVNEKDILFIDEAHRLKANIQESLYDVLDQFKFHRINGRGLHKAYDEIQLPKFSVFAGTTKEHELLQPLKNRMLIIRLTSYSFLELTEMARQRVNADPEVPMILAEHCRGTPRILDKLCAMFNNFKFQTAIHAFELVKMLNIFPQGLTNTEVEILKCLKNNQLSLNSLAAKLNLEEDVIKEEHEPYLVQKGLIERSRHGRELAKPGAEYLLKHNC